MRPRHWLFGLLVIVMVGLALAGGKSGQTAFAQQNRQQSDNGRFQISAWAKGKDPRPVRGATWWTPPLATSGRLWWRAIGSSG